MIFQEIQVCHDEVLSSLYNTTWLILDRELDCALYQSITSSETKLFIELINSSIQ